VLVTTSPTPISMHGAADAIIWTEQKNKMIDGILILIIIIIIIIM